jgi:hypothetical protein
MAIGRENGDALTALNAQFNQRVRETIATTIYVTPRQARVFVDQAGFVA